MNGTNRFLELQTVAALASYKDGSGQRMLDFYPEVIDYFTDPQAKSFYKAIRIVQDDNAVAIAKQMTHDGLETEPGEVKDVLGLLDKYGEVNIDTNVRLLRELHSEDEAGRLLRETQEKLRARKITVQQAAEILNSGLTQLSVHDESEFVSTDDWQTKAALMFRDRREAVKSGKLLTWPNDIPTLRKWVPYIDYGTLSMLVAPTGVGKSMFARRVAHWWAREHHRTVLYCSTELTNFQMICRDIADRTGKPLDDCLQGNVSEEDLACLTPYPGGGRVIYWEAAGKPLSWVISEATKYKADIIYDYLDMAPELNDSKKGSNEANRIGVFLGELKTYNQHSKTVSFIIQQMDKASQTSTGKGWRPHLLDGKGSSNIAQRPNYGLVLDFRELKDTLCVPHPILKGKQFIQDEGEISCFGNLWLEKNSFGRGVGRIPVFRFGDRSRIIEVIEHRTRLDDAMA
jgi:hypothetical protein